MHGWSVSYKQYNMLEVITADTKEHLRSWLAADEPIGAVGAGT